MFVPPSRRGAGRQGRLAAGVLAGVAAGIAVALSSGRHGARAASGLPSWAIIGILVGLGLVFILRRAMSSDAPESSDTSSTPADTEDNRHLLVVVAAIVACLLALGLFLGLMPRTASSQEPALQSAFILARGGDTLVVERITRSRESINGDVTIKGQVRITFTADVGAGPSVPTLTFKVWGAGASIDGAPLQSGTQRLTADSAFIVIDAGGTERKISRPISRNPLPIISNDFAMIELAIQRARMQAQSQNTSAITVPMFALSGGVQLDCTIEFAGKDTAVFRVAGQENRFGIDAAGRITGGIVPAQNIVITRVDGAATTQIAIGRPEYGAPAGAPYRAEEVVVKTPMGHVLTGTLTIPVNARGKVPAVVTITGSGQQDRDEYISLVPGYRLYRQVADTLGRRGIAVLRMDDRGINGSGGDLKKATTADFADDIRAGVAFLRARGEIDGTRIALVGHSEGGMIAPLVASTDPMIKAIVLMAGLGYTGRHISEIQNDTSIAQAPNLSPAQRDSLRRTVAPALDSIERGGGWMAFFLRYDPLPVARRVKVPVLIMQGSTDQQVTPDQAPVLEQAFKGGGNKDVTLKLFKDRNHLFLRDSIGAFSGYVKLTNGTIDGEVMGSLAEWLVARLKP